MKKVSVIVNCHNGEKYLKECIESILNQKYQYFEIVFFDNFSSDNSKTIVTKFQDKRIKYFFSNKKLSLYKARNEAIKVSTGEIIAFLDVDDWWNENYLSSREKIFDDDSYDYFYNNVQMYYEKNKSFKIYKKYFLPNGNIYQFLAKDYFIIISGLIIRRKIFSKLGFFNENLNIIGDFDFVMRMSKKFNAHATNHPLIFYRVHENNFSKLNTKMFFDEFNDWFNKQVNLNEKSFLENYNNFKKKLISIDINNLLINKKKNFDLFYKILLYPDFFKKIKYLVAFFMPKIIIQYFKK